MMRKNRSEIPGLLGRAERTVGTVLACWAAGGGHERILSSTVGGFTETVNSVFRFGP